MTLNQRSQVGDIQNEQNGPEHRALWNVANQGVTLATLTTHESTTLRGVQGRFQCDLKLFYHIVSYRILSV